MSPALRKLTQMRVKAVARRLFDSLGSVRGWAFLAAALGVVGLWLSLLFLIPRSHDIMRVSVQDIYESVGPVMLMATAMAILLGDDRTSRFTPAEIDILFPAPFERRELLTMKLVENIAGAALAAAFLQAAFVNFVKHPIASFLGTTAALLFVQFAQMAFVLLLRSVSERLLFVDRRVVAGGILALVAASVGATWLLFTTDLWSAWVTFRQGSLGTLTFLPFEPFARLIVVERLFPDGLFWLALAIGMNLLAAGIIYRLDESYIEEALGSSRRFQELLRRAQRGGVLSVWGAQLRWTLPAFPRWLGIGPILRRQATQAARSLPTLLAVLGVVVFMLIGPQMMLSRMKTSNVDTLVIGATAGVIQLTLIFTFMLRFDFRGELDQLEFLKSLPLSPFAVAIGELAVPVLLATFVQTAMLVGLILGFKETPAMLLIALMMVLPLNLFLFGLENLMFLLFPSRSVAFNPGDLQGVGHQVVLFAVKLLVMTAGTVVAALAGISCALTISYVAGAWVAWAILMTFGLATIPAVAWAYDRFDPSLERPPAE